MSDRADEIRVFLSYAQQRGDHPEKVRDLAAALRAEGLLSTIDQYEMAPTQGWRAWMDAQIRDAHWIVVVCSQVYFERASHTAPPTQGRGVRYESAQILDELYDAGMVNKRFVPVIFDREDAQYIPRPLQGFQRYLWDRDHEGLLRHLTNQPKVIAPPVASTIRRLPADPLPDVSRFGFGAGSSSSAASPPALALPDENPFTDVGPIRDEARFVGRTQEIERLRALLKSGSVNLWGEPKIGKSSLLRRVDRFWDGEVLGPFDCHGLIDVDDLYTQLGKTLRVDGDPRSVRDALLEGRRLLVIDELDAGPDRGLAVRDLQIWRHVQNENHDFHLLAASRRQLKDIFPDDGVSGSPAFNLTLPFELGAMPETEARELLRPPWTATSVFSPEQVDEIRADLRRDGCEGHPCWIQRAAHHRFEALRAPSHDWTVEWRRERSGLT